jgi:putative glutamine amidotransferase
MQLINVYYGGSLAPVNVHIGKRHRIAFNDQTLPTQEVNSYHQFGLFEANLGDGLNILATAPDNSIEAIRHHVHRVTGMMWHPEREPTMTSENKQFIVDALT